MDSIDELRKGALLAQAPANFQELDCLSSDDKAVLDHESKHRWSHPLLLWLTIFACSIGAATQGWDQTGSNGANLVSTRNSQASCRSTCLLICRATSQSFPDEFGISDRAGTPNAEYHSWLIGVINAAPYLSSAGLGCWLSDPLNNLVGRRGVIFLTALILIITVSVFASNRRSSQNLTFPLSLSAPVLHRHGKSSSLFASSWALAW